MFNRHIILIKTKKLLKQNLCQRESAKWRWRKGEEGGRPRRKLEGLCRGGYEGKGTVRGPCAG